MSGKRIPGSGQAPAGQLDEADLRSAEQLGQVYERMTQQLGRVIIYAIAGTPNVGSMT